MRITPQMGVFRQPPRVVASIEARMGASRLPGKVLADIGGKPALTRVLSRLRQCERIDGIVLATSTNARDDAVAAWAEAEGVACYRGSEGDVLLRVVEAHRQLGSDLVVEICGDMILLDPELVDLGIRTFQENDCDLVTTACKPSYPIGADVVVFRFKDIEWVARNVAGPEFREHVTLYFTRHPEKYRILHLFAPRRLEAPEYRFVLDYPEDLSFMRAVYARLEPVYGDRFGLREVMELLVREPALVAINRHCRETVLP